MEWKENRGNDKYEENLKKKKIQYVWIFLNNSRFNINKWTEYLFSFRMTMYIITLTNFTKKSNTDVWVDVWHPDFGIYAIGVGPFFCCSFYTSLIAYTHTI